MLALLLSKNIDKHAIFYSKSIDKEQIKQVFMVRQELMKYAKWTHKF